MENVHFNYRYSLEDLDKQIPDDLSAFPLYPVQNDVLKGNDLVIEKSAPLYIANPLVVQISDLDEAHENITDSKPKV